MRKKNRVLGILGNPLEQSMSPMVHNYWISKYNLDNYYCKFQLEKIDKIKTAIRVLNLQGLNVTIPYKKKIIKHLDKIDKTAKRLQAVNTINNNKGVLEGYNTDVGGFLLGLKNIKKLNKNKPAIVLGAGGAAESVVYSLHLIGVKNIYISNRTKYKAQMIARKYKEAQAVKWIEYDLVNDAGLIVNTTSLGMIGYPTLPISLERVQKSTKVYDIVYNPLETKLIKDAKKQKLEYVTGLSMFLGQAQESFRIWFNIKPSLSYYLISKLKKNIKML
jgi:shikimate dehydrogenase